MCHYWNIPPCKHRYVIRNRYDKTSPINCIESFSLSSIVHFDYHSQDYCEKLRPFSDKSTSIRRDGRSSIANMLACDSNPGSLKVFRRKTRPFLIFSMQARSAGGAFDTLY